MLLDTFEALLVCVFYAAGFALGYLVRRYWR